MLKFLSMSELVNKFLLNANEHEKGLVLGQLVTELIGERSDGKKGFIPGESWSAIQKAFVLTYPEVLVFRRQYDTWVKPPQILLTHRRDDHWKGWHIPGGRWADPTLTLEQACQSIARRELGLPVVLQHPLMFEKWNDHPYGNPLSLVCICSTPVDVIETEDMRFFDHVPEPIVSPHHADFINAGFDYIRNAL
jgi:ADP-ribose pyrophosphatase YjhB (NUDIX family)